MEWEVHCDLWGAYNTLNIAYQGIDIDRRCYVYYYKKTVIHFSCETFCGELGRETFENWAERVSKNAGMLVVLKHFGRTKLGNLLF